MGIAVESGQTNAVEAGPGLRGGPLFGSARWAAGRAKRAAIHRSTIEEPSKIHRNMTLTTRSQHRASTVATPGQHRSNTVPFRGVQDTLEEKQRQQAFASLMPRLPGRGPECRPAWEIGRASCRER